MSWPNYWRGFLLFFGLNQPVHEIGARQVFNLNHVLDSLQKDTGGAK
jgi:hypothetical protein